MAFSDLPAGLRERVRHYREQRRTLQKQGDALRKARDTLGRSLLASGLSLREVAEALEVSHELVRHMGSEAK